MRVFYSERSSDVDVRTEVHHNMASIQRIPVSMRFLAIYYGDAHNIRLELTIATSTQHLRELVIDTIYNFTTISGLENLTELQMLSITRCQITELPSQVVELTSLTGMILTENRLTQLPRTFKNLTKLTMLIVMNNKFIYVPAEIGYLPLNSVSFNGCPLVEVPAHYENNYDILPVHGRRRYTHRWLVMYAFLTLDCPFAVVEAVDRTYWHNILCQTFPKYDRFMETKN
jgi:Leucine-rich repeat (LRR) protein